MNSYKSINNFFLSILKGAFLHHVALRYNSLVWSSSYLAALAGVNSIVVARGAISTNPTLQVERRGGSWELFLARRHPKYNWGWAGCWCQGIYKHKNDSYVMFGRKCTENCCSFLWWRYYWATLTFRHLNPEMLKLRQWPWNLETESSCSFV